jgi:hypothetical protein
MWLHGIHQPVSDRCCAALPPVGRVIYIVDGDDVVDGVVDSFF